MQGRNSTGAAPVDEVRGEELNIWERDARGSGNLEEGFAGFGDMKEVA